MTQTEIALTPVELAAENERRRWKQRWAALARPEQIPPVGPWRVWYLRGGRGSGKTRTGSETLATWVREYDPGEWAIVAPTFGDARTVCAESDSGILRALGGRRGDVENWNRSEGKITVRNGAVIYLDGGDDGALRIQGKNLRAAWCDEIGLWRDWDRAWNESLAFAVRLDPGRLIATGTPKMGHPLVAMLLGDSTQTVHTHMRTLDNAENLHPDAVAALRAQYEGTTLGRQELEGEFIEALEGEILQRSDWRYYPKAWSFYSDENQAPLYEKLERFTQIVHSWDTAVKDKTTADYYSGQVWGCRGADRYLLRLWHAHSGFEQAKQQMKDMVVWAHEVWDDVPHRVIVEAAGIGPDIVRQLEREIQGLRAVPAKGDKVQRVWAASPALESHNCYLPGQARGDGTSYEPSQTPGAVQAFVEECAMFRADMKHAYDDQVDAWAQMVNWSRVSSGAPTRLSSPASVRLPRPRGLPPVSAAGGFRR